MKNLNKLLSLLLAVFMLMAIVPAGILTAEVENTVPDTAGEPIWDNPGAIKLDKYASANQGSNTDPCWEVTLKIDGKNYPTTSDVVLVIDNSNSMYTLVKDEDNQYSYQDIGDNRMNYTRQAAVVFVNNLLTADSATRIALVVYNKEIYDQTGFYDVNSKDELITKIQSITVDTDQKMGGTNTELGIYTAQQILESSASTGKNKNIVLLSDGIPTYSYKLTGTATWTGCDTGFITGSHYWGGSLPLDDNGSVVADSIVITDRNISSMLGSGYPAGEVQYVSGAADLTVSCEHGETQTVSDYSIGHDVGTVWEANTAKAAGSTIYSVSFQSGEEAEAMLKKIASNSTTDYFAIAESETDISGKLSSAFTAIAGSVAAAATNSVVTDPMGEFVNLKFSGSVPTFTTDLAAYERGEYDVYISQGTASYDAEHDIITWNSGTIHEGTTAVMRYHIVVDTSLGDSVPQGELDANKETIFKYTNWEGNPDTVKHFPIPVVNINGGVVRIHCYRVNSQGQPIAENGATVEPRFAEIAEVAVDTRTGLEWGQDHSFDYEEIAGYNYYGSYIVDNGTLTEGNTATVHINVNEQEHDIWFAYYQQFTLVHVRNDGTENITETCDVIKGFDFVDKTSEEYLYGGTFNNLECDSEHVTTTNPFSYDVAPNATYYIWEVNKLYLTPKNVNAWRHIDVEGNEAIVRFYPLTVVDRDMYQAVDFIIDGETKGYNNVVYTKIYAEQPVVGPDGSEQTTVSELSYRIWGNTSIVKDGSYVAYDRYLDFEQTFTVQPYWITLDNVKVKGNIIRTCEYRGEGIPESSDPNYYHYMNVTDSEGNISFEYVGQTADDVDTLMVSLPVSIGMEEIIEDITLTIVDGNNTYSVEVPAGDVSESVNYNGMNGMLFAGWYMDEAYTEAANLTEITEDATIYAKYVTDAYLNVKCINLRAIFSKTATLVSAVDNPENYIEAGFVVTVDGVETVIESGSFGNSYLFYNARNLFGSNVDKNAKLITLDYSLVGLDYGTVVNVQPYWVTMDGTTVYGTANALTYTYFGLVG